MVRIVTYQGFYVVAYALGIYLLNIFLLFLSPRFDPAEADAEGDALGNDAPLNLDYPSASGNVLPMATDEEFRPFVRRLPEFRFWYNFMWATTLSLLCTLFSAFDIPVFWPILLIYFVALTVATLRRQIEHMIKYRYIPFDFAKRQYS